MRRLIATVASSLMLGGGLFVGAMPAHATACTLVQSEIYNGANTISWARGLEGCSGDVYWEIQSADVHDDNWTVWDSGTTYYDNDVETYRGDVELPCYLRVYAKFGEQEKMTQPVVNNNCGGG